MKRKKIQIYIYLVLIINLFVGQSGISTVLAEMLTDAVPEMPELKLSIEKSEVTQGEEISVYIDSNSEEVSDAYLIKDDRLTEVKSEKISATRKKFVLVTDEQGRYEITAQMRNIKSNSVNLNVIEDVPAYIEESTNFSTKTADNSSVMLETEETDETAPSSDNTDSVIESVEKAVIDLNRTNISIQSPSEIQSNANVKLSIMMNASSIDLKQDGVIYVTIPKIIVRNVSDLTSGTLGAPFSWGEPKVNDDGNGNYVLNIPYDVTQIADEGISASIMVQFQSPIMQKNDTRYPNAVDFSVRLESPDLSSPLSSVATSAIVKSDKPVVPLFEKWVKFPRETIGNTANVAMMDHENPEGNIFNIVVNYNGIDAQSNVVVRDRLPEGTKLVEPKKYLPGVGNAGTIQHLRVLKVSQRADDGVTPKSYEYVTEEFANKITIGPDGKDFSVDFGDLAIGESYVIEYAIDAVDLEGFDIRYNESTMTTASKKITKKVPVSIKNDSFSLLSITKSVDKDMIYTSEELEYSLTLSVRDGKELETGATFIDELPKELNYLNLTDYDPTFIGEPTYDKAINQLKFTTMKPIQKGERFTVKFKAKADSSQLTIGENISNQAYLLYNNTKIYSNTVETKLAPNVILTKKDSKTGAILAGARFDLLDALGNTLQSNLETDETGRISVGKLGPGKYQFIETKAPEYYHLDQQPIEFIVEKTQTAPVELIKTNDEILGSVILEKIDEQNKEKLTGAGFDLFNKEGTVIEKDLNTDESGRIVVNNLPAGEYYFVETTAPKNYQLDPKPVYFKIEKGDDTPQIVVKTNRAIPGEVILTKTDALSGEKLSGAVFELQDSNGSNLLSDLMTDDSGLLFIDDLAPGDYQFVEIKAPEGYQLDKNPIPFSIEKGQNEPAKVHVTNEPNLGSVILEKTDKKTGEKLENAVFELQDIDGNAMISDLSTDNNGTLSVDSLKPGDYQFVETKAPEGYLVDKDPVKFTIDKTQNQPIVVQKTNELILGSVILEKIDEQTGESLQGALFDLKDHEGRTMIEGLETDDNGTLKVNDLVPGDYHFVETKAPKGYQLEDTPIQFTIKRGQTQPVEIIKTNKLLLGTVTLEKKDSQSGENLSGAVFDLFDQTGDRIISDLTTDENGLITIEDLSAGSYSLIERKAPAGYQLDKEPVTFELEKGEATPVRVTKINRMILGTVILTKNDLHSGEKLSGALFELQDQSGDPLQEDLETDDSGQLIVKDLMPGNYQFVETKAPTGYQLDQTPIPFVIEKGQAQPLEIKATNQLILGSITLEKTDDKTGEKLPGALFELQDQSGNLLQEDLETDDSGQLTVKNLMPGNYQFVETKAPTGYQLDQTPIPFKIKKGQARPLKITVKNKLILGSVTLVKTDEKTNERLQGAVFDLLDGEGNIVQSNLTSTADGEISVADLTPGNYMFVERQAPSGYQLDEEPIAFKIDKGDPATKTVRKTNQMIPGALFLKKIDKMSGESLQGAVFELKNDQGRVLFNELVTDTAGVLFVEDLTPGKYQIMEKQAPTGYRLDSTPLEFEIKKGNPDPVQLNMTNEKILGGVILNKIDEDNGQKLPGAVFRLQDETGKVLQKDLVTDDSGRISVGGLEPGNYVFVETEAPSGYQLDKEPLLFEIKNKSIEAIELTKTNKAVEKSIRLEKKDSQTDELLADASFVLKTNEGEVINKELITDKNGVLLIEDLPKGEYQLVETKAPEGYQLDKTPIPVIVDSQMDPIHVIKYNEPIKEVDEPIEDKPSENEEEPPAHEDNIEIGQSEDNELGTLDDSVIEHDKSIDEQPDRLVMDEDQPGKNVQNKSATDKKQDSIWGILPQTGSQNTLILSLVGILMVIFSLILGSVFLKKKK